MAIVGVCPHCGKPYPVSKVPTLSRWQRIRAGVRGLVAWVSGRR